MNFVKVFKLFEYTHIWIRKVYHRQEKPAGVFQLENCVYLHIYSMLSIWILDNFESTQCEWVVKFTCVGICDEFQYLIRA